MALITLVESFMLSFVDLLVLWRLLKPGNYPAIIWMVKITQPVLLPLLNILVQRSNIHCSVSSVGTRYVKFGTILHLRRVKLESFSTKGLLPKTLTPPLGVAYVDCNLKSWLK